MIELSKLEAMFENMQTESGWNLEEPLLWGYFFTDRSAEKLEALIPMFENQGFRFVDLFIPELDEGEEEYFFFHIEKEEVHTPNSLHQQNLHFYSLAELHQLDSYDGMDVGPIAS